MNQPTAAPLPVAVTHPHCAECFYYVPNAIGCGDCHRHPPSFIPVEHSNERHNWKHPKVHQHDWCGEFLPPAAH